MPAPASTEVGGAEGQGEEHVNLTQPRAGALLDIDSDSYSSDGTPPRFPDMPFDPTVGSLGSVPPPPPPLPLAAIVTES